MADLPEKATTRPAHSAELADACLLSFVAGYVDTCVFVGLFGLFTAHVTGNFVLIGAELVHHSGEVLPKILALPVFILAVALTVKAADALHRARRPAISPLMYCEAALLVVCGAAHLVLGAPVSATATAALVPGMLAAAAMGLQNAMTRLELASLPSTTVMTINVTQSAIDAVTMLSGRADLAGGTPKRMEARQRFARMWPPIVAFTAGAAAGAAGYAVAGLAALLLPALVCVVLGARFSGRTIRTVSERS
jgi:uncharacterized membrane protein YoaK (UPF0700 family)